MIETGDKFVTIRMDEELYKKIKVYVAENGITVKDFFTRLALRELYAPKTEK